MKIGTKLIWTQWFNEGENWLIWEYTGMTDCGNYRVENANGKWIAIQPGHIQNYSDIDVLKDLYPERFI